MISLPECKQEELQIECTQAERLAEIGDFSAGQEILARAAAEQLRAKDANEPHAAALADAWVAALQDFVADHGTPLIDVSELD